MSENPTSRCCDCCYHYGFFLGAPTGVRTCEHTGKTKKNPRLHTNCKKFAYVDAITGRKVVE